MTAPAPARPHTDAVIAAIETAAVVHASTVLIGRGIQPAGSGWQGEPGASLHRPYVVVYPSPGVTDGSVAEPTEYLDYSAQATCVAADQAGAEAVADLVKAAWVNVPLTIAGRASYPGEIIADRPVTRDDSVAVPLHYAVVQVVWRTQAA